MANLNKKIATIPGGDGWWKSSGEDRFNEAATELIEHGYTEEEAIQLLTDLYWEVANCYGG